MKTQLYARSAYSMGQSALKIDEYVSLAKAEGYETVALCDRNILSGMPVFQQACRKYGIHGIIGLEAMADYGFTGQFAFVLLAEDREGLKALMGLSSDICAFDSFADSSDISGSSCDIELVKKAADHCVLIIPTEGSWLSAPLHAHNEEELMRRLRYMKQDLPFFQIGMTLTDRETADLLRRCASQCGIEVLAMPMVMYGKKEDRKVCRLVQAVYQGTVYPETPEPEGCHLLSMDEIQAFYTDEEIQRAEDTGAECVPDLQTEPASLPVYPDTRGMSADAYFTALCRSGLKKRLKGKRHLTEERIRTYEKRLEKEIGIICGMHFENYFLIVFDYVRFARENGIGVGIGRGSGVASLCAYSIGITNVDPVEHDLLFERFLNPLRRGMPDIDIDFDSEGRKDVIAYVRNKYGEACTGGIIVYSCYHTLNALHAAAKAVGCPEAKLKRFTSRFRRLLNQKQITLAQAEKDPDVHAVLAQDKALRQTWNAARLLDGIPCTVMRHPSGVVVADRPLTEVEPVISLGRKEMLCGQFEENSLEERGLIKMDFLSLPSMKPLLAMERMIRVSDPSFSFDTLDMEDPKIYQTFARGYTAGYFQFDTPSMRRILLKVKPDCFHDLAAVNALDRADLQKYTDEFAKRHAYPEQVVYPSEELREVLGETYGIMLYQEQAIMTAHTAADFDFGEADELRRKIKKKESMADLKENFISRCMSHQAHPYDRRTAETLWEEIAAFAGYGYNKAHAVSYTIVPYRQAYVKVYYPDIYYRCMRQYGGFKNDRLQALQQEERKLSAPKKPQRHDPELEEARQKYNIHVQPLSDCAYAEGNTAGFGRVLTVETRRNQRGEYLSIMLEDESGSVRIALDKDRAVPEMKPGSLVWFSGKIYAGGSIYARQIRLYA